MHARLRALITREVNLKVVILVRNQGVNYD